MHELDAIYRINVSTFVTELSLFAFRNFHFLVIVLTLSFSNVCIALD